tara:strand:- start:1597 stop:3411 length:1815 start_codon:yes stop_codon:yes gene_type:complete
MKYINFNKLTIKNFLSVGEDPVVITFNKGINIITGINKDKADRRNGVGKSTIADALYFTIFGSTIRELKKENIPNNISAKGTETSVNFTVTENNDSTDYTITRLLKPSKCYIYKDGVDTTRDSIFNTSKYISDLLSSTSEVFQNCIIMTLNNTTPFMAQKKIEKRKFIEGILNLQVFSDMLLAIKGEYNDAAKDFDVECARYEEASSQIETYNNQKIEQANNIKLQVEKLQTRERENKTEIKRLKEKAKTSITKSISEYNKSIQKNREHLDNCQLKYDEIMHNISVLDIKNAHLKDNLNRIGTDNHTCPVCLKPVTDHDKALIEEERAGISKGISDNKISVDQLKEKVSTLQSLKKTLLLRIEQDESKVNKQRIAIKEKDNILKRINQLEELNSQTSTDIKEALRQKKAFNNVIETTTNKLSTIQKDIDDLKSIISKLDIVKFVVSEEGVKSYIVKKILQLLNGKLAYYLKKMDANCVCVFNEYFEEQIIDEKGKICSYYNFSGAERKNIDLACLFAFMDIRRLQGDVAFNFSIYDELLDSSLDETGIDLVLDILRERVEKYDECAMVISHRKESTKFATNDIIYLQKENGITTRVVPPRDVDK